MILKFLMDKNKNVKESGIRRSRVELTFSLMFHRLWLSHGFGFPLLNGELFFGKSENANKAKKSCLAYNF